MLGMITLAEGQDQVHRKLNQPKMEIFRFGETLEGRLSTQKCEAHGSHFISESLLSKPIYSAELDLQQGDIGRCRLAAVFELPD